MAQPPTVTDIANLLVAATALVVALISAFYTWRAFALQRQASSAVGLRFLHVVPFRRIDKVGEDGDQRLAFERYSLVRILARGPGQRYKAEGHVWGPAEAQVVTPSVNVWTAEHGGIDFRLQARSNEEWKDVFCGVVWERPSLITRNFVQDGFRAAIEKPGSYDLDRRMQRWSPLRKKWVPYWSLPRLRKSTPADGATESAESLDTKLQNDHHADADLAADLNGFLDEVRRKFAKNDDPE